MWRAFAIGIALLSGCSSSTEEPSASPGGEGGAGEGAGEGATLALDFERCELASPVTFARASGGTYHDAEGNLRLAAADEPRCDHDLATGEPLGLLIEGAATNHVWNATGSELDDAGFPSAWDLQYGTPMMVTITTTEPAPDRPFRDVTMRFESEGGDGSWFQIMLNFDLEELTAYTHSWYARSDETEDLHGCSLFGSYQRDHFGEELGELPQAELMPQPHFQRVSTTFVTAPETDTGQMFLGCTMEPYGTVSLTVRAPQLEKGLSASSPIPTSDEGSADRGPDMLDLDATGLFGRDAGSLIAELFLPSVDRRRSQVIVYAEGGAGEGRHLLFIDGVAERVRALVDTEEVAADAAMPWTAASRGSFTIAYGFDPRGIGLVADGYAESIERLDPAPRAPTVLHLGRGPSGDALVGALRRLELYPRRLDQAGLTRRSTP